MVLVLPLLEAVVFLIWSVPRERMKVEVSFSVELLELV